MAGKKGRSGRKPNTDGKKMRAVNLYIPMYEYDVSHFNSPSAKMAWIPESWFRQFKRIYGSRWQERVRAMIMQRTKEYERQHMWSCQCQGRLHKWHFKHEGFCPRCDKVPSEDDRYKTKAERRIHSKENPNKDPLNKCPHCKAPLQLNVEWVAGQMSSVMRCPECDRS